MGLDVEENIALCFKSLVLLSINGLDLYSVSQSGKASS